MTSTLKRLLPVSAAILVGSLFGARVFAAVFGPDWRTAGEYVAVLAVPFALQILTSPVSITANLMDRQDLQLLFDGVRIAAVVAALVAAPLAGVGPGGAVAILAVVLSLTYVGYLVMYWSLLKGKEA
jgi:O-antigen/teichoic acid export membrane protein